MLGFEVAPRGDVMGRLAWACLSATGIALAGCSSAPSRGPSPAKDTAQQVPTGPDDLPVPDHGFQVRNVGADIGPGEDIEYCEIGELPGTPSDTYYVSAFELANAPFSHHLVVAAAIPGSAADSALRTLNLGDRVQCNGATFEWPEDGLVGLASAQTEYISRGFPDGVGTTLFGNQRVVFDYHYVNSSEETVRAESAFNVHVVDGASISHIATAFSFFNFTIDIPPGQSGAFTSECHFTTDLMVAGLVRHTHQQGRDFSVWFSGGPKDQEPIWTSHDWKQEPGYDFPEPVLVRAGEGFRFQCNFENPSDSRLRYGIRGTDEMCILAGWVWGAGDEKELPSRNCGVTWTDSEGIGHPASESGGFPPASPADAQLCLAGINAVGVPGLSSSCNDCVCNSCGSVLLKCAEDPDCAALIKCLGQGCGDQSACIQTCKQELHDHSSAVGMLQEVQSCLGSKCGACGPTPG
jgi:Copper type II ascorbate-dependent monooxygenase, C-terminal domain